MGMDVKIVSAIGYADIYQRPGNLRGFFKFGNIDFWFFGFDVEERENDHVVENAA